MGTTTFSGPIRAGTEREGANANVGAVLLTQTYTIPAADMVTAGATRTAFRLPANAKIVEVVAEVVTAITTATQVALTVGLLGGTANRFFTTFNTGVTVARVPQATVEAAQQVANTNNVGSTDVGVTITSTATTGNAGAGVIQVTILYVQN